MRPARVDLPTIWRGCDWGVVTIIWKDKNGNPFNLTGWRVRAETNQMDLNAAVTDPVNGTTQLSLTKDQTANLRLGQFSWDLVFGYGSPVTVIVGPLLAGSVTVKQPISLGILGGGDQPVPTPI